MSRAFNSLAMSPKDLAPAAVMSSITGARSAARAFADADRACRALAQSPAVPGRPRKPPRRLKLLNSFTKGGVSQRALSCFSP
jgi:hypothetical protein